MSPRVWYGCGSPRAAPMPFSCHVPTMDILTLRAQEWRDDFFPSGWYALLYSTRTDLPLKCRFITSVCVSRGNDENSKKKKKRKKKERKKEKRMHNYVSLLKQMAPEHVWPPL